MNGKYISQYSHCVHTKQDALLSLLVMSQSRLWVDAHSTVGGQESKGGNGLLDNWLIFTQQMLVTFQRLIYTSFAHIQAGPALCHHHWGPVCKVATSR
jgi:hypothetical protein